MCKIYSIKERKRQRRGLVSTQSRLKIEFAKDFKCEINYSENLEGKW